MPDFPIFFLAGPPIITPYNVPEACQGNAGAGANSLGSTASASWVNNNEAVFYPFTLSGLVTVYDLFFYVGSASSGNIDVGIYDAQRNRLVSSGSTAMSATTNAVQVLPCTDTVLNPGDYLMGAACSTTAGTCVSNGSNADELTYGSVARYTQATALPLPDPCVPILSAATAPKAFVYGAICRTIF